MKTKQIFLTSLLLFSLLHVFSSTYYVRPDGNNANSGMANTTTDAWLTLNYAISSIIGGDTLFIADGSYMVDPLEIRNVHGTEDDPTVIAAINQWGAKITLKGSPEWGNTLVTFGSSYIEIDGLEVFGTDPTKGTGIQASEESHHIIIRNCYVHDCGCNGISARGSDYVTVEKNIVQDNAKRSEYNCSGISFYLPREHDQEPGYHFIIKQNIAFENECNLPFTPGGFDTPTDGNGIIMDLFNNPYGNDEGEPNGYKPSTLIENNLSFNNGGRGIHIYKSNNVVVRNNTTWYNLKVLWEYDKWKGDMETFESKNLKFYNNLVVQNPDLPTQGLRMYEVDTKSEVYNNLVVGVKDFYPKAPFNLENTFLDATEQAYPQLLNPDTLIEFDAFEDLYAYFGLQKTSPAIDAGNSNFAPMVDLIDNARQVCNNVDIGAFEFRSENDTVPFVKIVAPEERTQYYLGDEIIVNAKASQCNGNITSVALYDLDVFIEEITAEPFSFTIADADVGVHRYRAEAKTANGATGESEKIIVHVVDKPAAVFKAKMNESFIYPNPAKSAINIMGHHIYSVKIYDLYGKIVISEDQLSGNQQIEIGGLSCGIYLVKLIEKKNIYQSRLVVN